jgi:3-hydroxyisobutyrate dehydrogenase-like beta-hydroxyacid dehydrogenase
MSKQTSEAIGVIGCGNIGSQITHHLLNSNFDVRVYDKRNEAMQQLVERGAKIGESPAHVMKNSDIVVLSLPSPKITKETVIGDDGLIEHLAVGDVIIDTSTSIPRLSENLDSLVNERGGEFLAIPLSGGGDDTDQYTAIVGGDLDIFEECEDVVNSFSSRTIYVGSEAQMSHAAKLLNQYLSFASWILTSEAIAFGEEMGIEMTDLLKVLNNSSGRNSKTESSFPDYIESGDYNLGAPVRIMEKDLRLLNLFAYHEEVMLSYAPLIYRTVSNASDVMGEETDMTNIYTFVKDEIDIH